MTNLILTSYVAYLINCKKLNPLMSSYQILRNTLLHLREFQQDPRFFRVSICSKLFTVRTV